MALLIGAARGMHRRETAADSSSHPAAYQGSQVQHCR